MLTIESYSLAVVACVLAMICWGSWQNTTNLAGRFLGRPWRFELYYWDFVTGILLFSLLYAVSFGSMGGAGRDFFSDLAQAEAGNLVSAMIGGTIWNLGTLLLVAAIAIAGMSVAFPIGGGIGWLLGIAVNYVATPVGHPVYLFGGMAFIVVAILFSMASYRRLASGTQRTTAKGILLSVAAGVLIAFFYRFAAASMIQDFSQPEAGKLTPYTASVCFALGAFLSTWVFNSVMMKRPVEGRPLSYDDYREAGLKIHLAGVLGGGIWLTGMTFSLLAAGQAGFAISYGLSNSAPVVAALWGIFMWQEFAQAPEGTNRLLAAMFACYLVGLALIVISRYA